LRVDAEVVAKDGPVVPAGDGELGSTSHHAGIDGLQDSAIVTAEAKLLVG